MSVTTSRKAEVIKAYAKSNSILYSKMVNAAGKTVEALIGELKRLLLGIPDEELHRARELAKGRMLLRLEDTRAVSGWLGGQEGGHGNHCFLHKIILD